MITAMDEKFDDGVEKRGKTWYCSEIKSRSDFISTHDRSTLLVGSCVKFGRIFGVRVVQEKPISRCESGVSRNPCPGFIFNTIKKSIGSTLD